MAQHDPETAEFLAEHLVRRTMEDARAARLRHYARVYRDMARKVEEVSR